MTFKKLKYSPKQYRRHILFILLPYSQVLFHLLPKGWYKSRKSTFGGSWRPRRMIWWLWARTFCCFSCRICCFCCCFMKFIQFWVQTFCTSFLNLTQVCICPHCKLLKCFRVGQSFDKDFLWVCKMLERIILQVKLRNEKFSIQQGNFISRLTLNEKVHYFTYICNIVCYTLDELVHV